MFSDRTSFGRLISFGLLASIACLFGPYVSTPVKGAFDGVSSGTLGSQVLGTRALRSDSHGDAAAGLSLDLGSPGFSLRQEQVFGYPGLAHFRSAAYLAFPWGIATDPKTSEVWIADSAEGRVLRFDESFRLQPEPSSMPAIGWPADLATYTEPERALPGGGGRQSAYPVQIIADTARHVVWTLDRRNSNSAGLLLGELDVNGDDAAHFENPVGVAVDGNLNYYVSDGSAPDGSPGNHRIQIFSRGAAFLATIGETGMVGTDNLHLNRPSHLAIASRTILYVADTGNHRVQIFDVQNPATPRYMNTVGVSGEPGSDELHFDAPEGLAVDGAFLYVADTGNCRVQVFRRSDLRFERSIGASPPNTCGSDPQQFDAPSDIAIDGQGSLYVTDPGNFRVVKVTKDDRREILGVTGVPYPADPGYFNAPVGVASAGDGSLYLVEKRGQRLIKLDAAGKELWQVGLPGLSSPRGIFDRPSDVAVGADGRVFVADSGNDVIRVYDEAGQALSVEGGPGTAPGQLDCPSGLGSAADGRMFVADTCNHRVQIFDSDWQLQGSLGRATQPGQDEFHFRSPEDVAVAGDGTIYVADTGNHRVQVFDASLKLVRTIGKSGELGSDFGHFDNPRRLAVDADGRLYVADGLNHRLQVFDDSGRYLTTMGGKYCGVYAASLIQGCLWDPGGVAVSQDGKGRDPVIFVADTGWHRIYRLAVGVDNWRQENINGFGDPETTSVALAMLRDEVIALTAGQQDSRSWQYRPDGSWEELATNVLGGLTNGRISQLLADQNRLFALVWDWQPGWQFPRYSAWESGDAMTWTAITPEVPSPSGRSDARKLFAFAGEIYLAIQRYDIDSSGSQLLAATDLWRRDVGGIEDWARAATFAKNEVRSVGSATVHGDMVYLTVSRNNGQDQVLRSADGSSWQEVSPLGFGNPQSYWTIGGMQAFEDRLYLGISSREGGIEVWRCATCDGDDWEPAVASDFRADLFARFDDGQFSWLYAFGASDEDVWRSRDGQTWESVATNRFGDPNNSVASALESGGRLILGVNNFLHGVQVWSTDGQVDTLPRPTSPAPTAVPTARPRPQPPRGRTAYRRVDQWPAKQDLPPDALASNGRESIRDMDIADDGTLFIVDQEHSRVVTLQPDGTWGATLGDAGSGAERLGQASTVAVDNQRDRVYVGDHASERIVVYTLDGRFLTAWDQVDPAAMALGSDGRLWVADRLLSQVRAYDPSGLLSTSFGSFGDDVEDQFRGLVDLVLDQGGGLHVADLEGARIREFRLKQGRYVRSNTLLIGTGRSGLEACDGRRLLALGGTRIAAGPCLFEAGTLIDQFSTDQPGSNLYEVRYRSVNLAAPYSYAVATSDPGRAPNSRSSGSPTTVLVRYPKQNLDLAMRTWTLRTRGAGQALDSPLRLSAAPDGSLSLSLVDRRSQWREFQSPTSGIFRVDPSNWSSRQLASRVYPNEALKYTVDPEFALTEGANERVMLVGGSRIVYAETAARRYCINASCEVHPYIEPIWSTTLDSQTEGIAAIAHEPTGRQFLVLSRRHMAPHVRGIEEIAHWLSFFPLDENGRSTEIQLPGNDREAIWSDVEAGPDGRIYVLDTLGDRIQVFSPSGEDLGSIPTPRDSFRVAAGPNAEAYVLTLYGQVVRLAADGRELARFDARPHAGLSPTSLVDLAVDAAAYVYTVDAFARQISVFAPEGIEDDVLLGPSCSFAPDKWAEPRDVVLGDSVTLRLGLSGTCGFVEEPTDIVLAIDTSGLSLGDDPGRVLAGRLRVARQIAALTDLSRHRLGVVAFATNGQVYTGLTQDLTSIVDALELVFAGNAASRPYAGLVTARGLFEKGAERRRVVIVVSSPESANGELIDKAGLDLAEAMRSEGIFVAVVNRDWPIAAADAYNNLTVAPRGHGAGRVVYQRITQRRSAASLTKSGRIVDTLPINMDYVPGSAVPAASWDPVARTLSWELPALDFQTLLLSLQVRPTQPGEWPTNVEAIGEFVDGWDNARRIIFPVPFVRVYREALPTATPRMSPSPTPTDEATPTLQPTSTPPPILYLPLIISLPCRPTFKHADVALVIDTSSSMAEATSPGGPRKLDAAIAAARAFLNQLDFPADQAALVQFNESARVVVRLVSSREETIAGLDNLSQATGTRIDLGILEAQVELSGAAHRADNNPVIVLLSDGEASGVRPEAVVQIAEQAQEAGSMLITIGLGAEADSDLLRALASRPDWYYHAAEASDLERIYRDIAFSIPCAGQ